MFTLYHGFQDKWDAPDAKVVLALVENLLLRGNTNILITRDTARVTGDVVGPGHPEHIYDGRTSGVKMIVSVDP